MKTKIADQIKNAVVYLAEVDDGAIKADNQGFNKFDTNFGNAIANRIRAGNVTPAQLIAAHKMIIRYKKQLTAAGYEIPKFIEPEKTPSKNGKGQKRIAIDKKDGNVLIFFGGRPSPAEREKIDRLPFRKWNPNKKDMPWETYPIYARNVDILFGNLEGWEYSAEYLEALKSAPEIIGGTPEIPQIDFSTEHGIMIYFNGRPSPENHELVKASGERKWRPELPGSPWVVSSRLIEDVFEKFPHATFTQEIKAELQKRRSLAEMSRSAKSTFEIPGLTGTLFPFQNAGIEFIEKSNGRCLLADEMGLGKTIQTIGYLQLHPELRPAIIVTPASLKINWQRELEKWLSTDDEISILSGRTPKPELYEGKSILIINYEILTGWEQTLLDLKPQFVAVDEAHKCKNPKAQRTQVVQELAKVSKGFIPMTGTPIRNRPAELYTQLNMISPKDWGNWWHYMTRYNNFVRGFGMGAPAHLDELHHLIKPYVIRRTKTEVLKELPPKIRTTIVMEFDESERKNYNHYISEAAQTTGGDHLAMIEKAKQAAARGKLPAVIHWISEFLETGEKLVVFANHREIAKALSNEFSDNSVMLIGGLTQEKRQSAVDRFQDDPSVQLFIGNLDAAGVGITLTAASNVAIIEFPWTPDTIEQAGDRCHRIGQVDSVTIWHMVADGTIEESIVELLEAKAATIHKIMDNKNVEKEFSILNELSNIIRTQTENITETIEEL